jgi:hypothetical protein
MEHNKHETVMEACEALWSDKNFDGFAYRADTYCWNCMMSYLKEHPEVASIDASDRRFTDSDYTPQPIFFGFGDADFCMHCATCGKYLYGRCDENDECQCDHCATV